MSRLKELRYFTLVLLLFGFIAAGTISSCRDQKKKESTEEPAAEAESEEHPTEAGSESEEHPSAEGEEHPTKEGDEHPTKEGDEHPTKEGEEHPKDTVS